MAQKYIFSHGSGHSCGVAVLVRKSLDFKLKSFQADEKGRFICIEASIQGTLLLLVNINFSLRKTAANFTEISRKHVFATSNGDIIENRV